MILDLGDSVIEIKGSLMILSRDLPSKIIIRDRGIPGITGPDIEIDVNKLLDSIHQEAIKNASATPNTNLAILLSQMDVPTLRRDTSKIENLRWLDRNLVIRNGTHRAFSEATTLIRKMLK